MANRPGEDLLLVENLEVQYGEVQVLWGISFSARQGQVTCMIGPNGAGKTTTLKTLAGVLPVKGGRVSLRGEDITKVPPHGRVTRRMSLVPEGRQLWPGMSVEDNLLMGCFIPALRKNAKTSLPRIYDLFPRLKERRHQMAGTLSGG